MAADTALPVSIATYGRFASVSPSDSTDLTEVSDAIMVGVTGNVAVNDFRGNTVTLTGLQAGVVYQFRVKRVMATNTTATSIVQLFKGI